MTRNEAEERAKKIWGDKLIKSVLIAGRSASEWSIEVDSGVFRWHLLDKDGHTNCHSACAQLEMENCK